MSKYTGTAVPGVMLYVTRSRGPERLKTNVLKETPLLMCSCSSATRQSVLLSVVPVCCCSLAHADLGYRGRCVRGQSYSSSAIIGAQNVNAFLLQSFSRVTIQVKNCCVVDVKNLIKNIIYWQQAPLYRRMIPPSSAPWRCLYQ